MQQWPRMLARRLWFKFNYVAIIDLPEWVILRVHEINMTNKEVQYENSHANY